MASDSLFREGQKSFLEERYDDSIHAFTGAIESGEEVARALLSRGVAYLKTGDLKKAVADFTEVLAENQDAERAHFFRGMTYLNQGEYDKAIIDLDFSIAQNPKRGAAFVGRGLAYAELGDDALARENIKHAVVLGNVEKETFINDFAISHTMFNRSVALFDGDRGPWSIVVKDAEMEKIKQWS